MRNEGDRKDEHLPRYRDFAAETATDEPLRDGIERTAVSSGMVEHRVEERLFEPALEELEALGAWTFESSVLDDVTRGCGEAGHERIPTQLERDALVAALADREQRVAKQIAPMPGARTRRVGAVIRRVSSLAGLALNDQPMGITNHSASIHPQGGAWNHLAYELVSSGRH
jgi:hypothetical protein